MKKFKYTAININKTKFSGTFFAENEEHLKKQLSDQQLYLVSCKMVKDKTPNAFFSLTGKVSIKELTNFSRQLSIMMSSSIEVINCLEILKNQSYTKLFRDVLEIVYEDVKSGKLLSEAMEKHKKIFPEFFRSMVYVGEMSSSLDKVLVNIADYYETENKIRSKTKSAFVYPAMLLVLMVGIIVLLMVFVIPTFRTSLAQLEVDMPAITLAIYNISDFFIANWKYLFLGVVAIWLLIKLFKKSKSGRMFFDTLKLRIPIFKKIQISLVTSRFSRGFGLLLASGMNMVDAMEIIEKVLGNKYVEKKFKQATEDVRKGIPLTKALENMKVFPVMLTQMVAVGEKTANLDGVLLRSCDYFDQELELSLSAITSIIQPSLMIVMGVIIAVMFIAVYSPIISVMDMI